MTRDEIKDIRKNFRDALGRFDELDELEEWGQDEAREAKDLLSDLTHYMDRQKSYYSQYRGV